MRHLKQVAGLLGLAALAASGCATPQSVSAKNDIATARFAIQDAEAHEADVYAPKEIAEARAKLEEARNVTPDIAQRRAEEATQAARLAGVTADREMARAQLAEAQRVRRATETLERETRKAVQETAR